MKLLGFHLGDVQIGFRMQQYFGPLYDLDMASINLNWESDVVNHQPTPENQSMCIYGDPTGFSSGGRLMRTVSGSLTIRHCWPNAEIPISVLFLGDSFMEGYDDKNTLPYHVEEYFKRREVS
jgi:hypothetical protein